MTNGPIKSPFVNTKVIEKTVSPDSLIEDAVKNFGLLIQANKENGNELHPAALEGFIAGFAGTLISIGFNPKDAVKVGERLTKTILSIGGINIKCSDPDCDKCKK